MERLAPTARHVPINPDVFNATAPDVEDKGHAQGEILSGARRRLSDVAHRYLLHMDKMEIAAALEEVIECLRAVSDFTSISNQSNSVSYQSSATLIGMRLPRGHQILPF
jgi:hypothetical protein